MPRAQGEGIEAEIARLKHVSKALMQQLNVGAATPDLVLQGLPARSARRGARPWARRAGAR